MLRRWSIARLALVGVALAIDAWLFGNLFAYFDDQGAKLTAMLGIFSGLAGAGGATLVAGLLWPAIVLATLRRPERIRAFQREHGVADPDSPDPLREHMRRWMDQHIVGKIRQRYAWTAFGIAASISILHLLPAISAIGSPSRWDIGPGLYVHLAMSLLAAILTLVFLRIVKTTQVKA
jgi:hypothetical protein